MSTPRSSSARRSGTTVASTCAASRSALLATGSATPTTSTPGVAAVRVDVDAGDHAGAEHTDAKGRSRRPRRLDHRGVVDVGAEELEHDQILGTGVLHHVRTRRDVVRHQQLVAASVPASTSCPAYVPAALPDEDAVDPELGAGRGLTGAHDQLLATELGGVVEDPGLDEPAVRAHRSRSAQGGCSRRSTGRR